MLLDGGRASAEDLTPGRDAGRFRSSLGSRLLSSDHGGNASLIVTGTPGRGARSPWRFDLRARRWRRLPEAPEAILSSAAFMAGDTLTIVGGWSKERGCHGRVQTLALDPPAQWRVAPATQVPWRRPGAGRMHRGSGILVALGWMETRGAVGTPGFRLLRRNGASQRAASSSSRLCSLADDALREVSVLPQADSFEHNGELYEMGGEVLCIGRDQSRPTACRRARGDTGPCRRS